MEPKFPNVRVQLTGKDGNAFYILGAMTRALRKEGVAKADVDAFLNEAMSGDYNNLLATCMKWVEVD